MKEQILKVKEIALGEIENTQNAQELFDVEKKYLGRKSEFVSLLKNLKNLPDKEKKEMGMLANETKQEIQEALEVRKVRFNSQKDSNEKIDVTIPGEKASLGHLHILTQVQEEIEDIFTSMGFQIADGPEVETEFYNFDALNIPQNHPARDKWDTFWLKSEKSKEKVLLRTHTSPVQVRFMQKNKPPFRLIVPGKCFRNEATDATHEHTFYQFEALVVGEDVNVGEFKYIGEQFFSRFFNREIKVRLRPSFFPFTEPSFEFDISCTVCGGTGCRSCKGGGWLEIGGAGMVNQKVFEAAGYKSNEYQGFAWGFGIERLAMMKYKVDDVRLFHSGDLRFIRQF